MSTMKEKLKSFKDSISRNKGNIEKVAAGSAGAAGVVGGLGTAKGAQIYHDAYDETFKSYKESPQYKILKNIDPIGTAKMEGNITFEKGMVKGVRDLGLAGAGIGGAVLAGVIAKHYHDKKKKKSK